uniref:MIF4G domain-containing protein n=1 Tax=Arion vulgaris TaxID=1028688 RepID=A0A0B6ZPJ6_9EUPU
MCYFSTDNILFSTMSSKDNSKNEGCANNQSCDNSLPGKDTVPRLPTMETATRLRNRMLKTQTEHQATPKSTQPNPGPDFSNPPPNVNQLTQMQDSQQPLTSVSQSKLSATAKEFVPRCQNIAHDSCDSDSSTILDEINNLNLQESYDPDSEYEVPSELAGNLILERFHHALNVLNLNPGNMEEYLRPVCEMIHRSSNTTEIVNVVVESLFEQSIQESNFRYTGARICQFLHSNLKDTSYFSGFREIFLKRCQKEYNRRNELKNGSQAGQERLRGLSMFMAEVLLNVQAVAADGSMQPLTFCPKSFLILPRLFCQHLQTWMLSVRANY